MEYKTHVNEICLLMSSTWNKKRTRKVASGCLALLEILVFKQFDSKLKTKMDYNYDDKFCQRI